MKGRLQLSDGGELAYQVIGDGPPLLLVSGLGGVASFWKPFAEVCASRYTVVLHDHRGTGASSRCLRPYSIASMADDVVELSAHLGLETPFYIGHSTGGAIGQHLAVTQKLDIQAMVLSATFARPCAYFRRLFSARLQVLQEMGLNAYREQSALLLYPPYWLASHPVDVSAQRPHAQDAEITRRRILAVLQHDELDQLATIQRPTLVIGARDDIVTPDYHSAELAQSIPNAELVLLPRGGHYLPHTDVERYRRHVLSFLKKYA